MTQYWLGIGYKLPDNPDLAEDARRLEADALNERAVVLRTCENTPNKEACRRDAEFAFREAILGIQGVRFFLSYSENPPPNYGFPRELIELKPEWVTNQYLDQYLRNLYPNSVYPLGLSIDTWSRQFRREWDGQLVPLQQAPGGEELAEEILSSLPRHAQGPPKVGSYSLGVFAILTLVIPLDIAFFVGDNLQPFTSYVNFDWIPNSYALLATTHSWSFTYMFQPGGSYDVVDNLLSALSIALTAAGIALYFVRRRRAAGSLMLLSVLVILVLDVYGFAQFYAGQIPQGIYLIQVPGAFLLQLALGAGSFTKSTSPGNFGNAVAKTALGAFLVAFTILLEYLAVVTGSLALMLLGLPVLLAGFVATLAGARGLSRV